MASENKIVTLSGLEEFKIQCDSVYQTKGSFVTLSGAQTISGTKTFLSAPQMSSVSGVYFTSTLTQNTSPTYVLTLSDTGTGSGYTTRTSISDLKSILGVNNSGPSPNNVPSHQSQGQVYLSSGNGPSGANQTTSSSYTAFKYLNYGAQGASGTSYALDDFSGTGRYLVYLSVTNPSATNNLYGFPPSAYSGRYSLDVMTYVPSGNTGGYVHQILTYVSGDSHIWDRYGLYTNSTTISWSDWKLNVKTLTLNGTLTDSTSFYAPTSSGTDNQVLYWSDASSKPIWKDAPSAPVTSVAGKTGAVTLAAGDISTGTFAAARLPDATSTTKGAVKLGASGGAATYEHTHGLYRHRLKITFQCSGYLTTTDLCLDIINTNSSNLSDSSMYTGYYSLIDVLENAGLAPVGGNRSMIPISLLPEFPRISSNVFWYPLYLSYYKPLNATDSSSITLYGLQRDGDNANAPLILKTPSVSSGTINNSYNITYTDTVTRLV